MQIDADGATLHVAVDGDPRGAPLLLWNGAGCTLRMWDLVVPKLADRHRLIRFDVRGTGESTPAADAARYTFEQYADDANRVLDHLGIERTHVWSIAWGSRAALAYCALHPNRVVSFMLSDASIGPADVAAQLDGARRALDRQLAAGIPRFDPPDGWNHHRTPETVPLALAAAGKFDLRGAAAKLTMPVLVATGDHDPNLSSSRELVALAPSARLVVLRDVGHGSVLQRPDLATQAFLDFQDSIAHLPSASAAASG
jgi:3-oxoadipate enol-lactonase